MSNLHRGFAPAAYVGAATIAPARDITSDQARRPPTVMRKFEIAVLRPDLSVSFNQILAPATPLFESCAAALARGTLIDTVRGPVAIEDLIPGDYIQTAMGAEPVTWIGSTTYIPSQSNETTSLNRLARVTSDAMGIGHPPMDLLLGQEAVLVPVADYTDGDRYLEVTPAGTVQLYHLMVRRHTTLDIGGVQIETFHPGNGAHQQLTARTRDLFMSLFPHLDGLGAFGETCATRTTREVVESLLNT